MGICLLVFQLYFLLILLLRPLNNAIAKTGESKVPGAYGKQQLSTQKSHPATFKLVYNHTPSNRTDSPSAKVTGLPEVREPFSSRQEGLETAALTPTLGGARTLL